MDEHSIQIPQTTVDAVLTAQDLQTRGLAALGDALDDVERRMKVQKAARKVAEKEALSAGGAVSRGRPRPIPTVDVKEIVSVVSAAQRIINDSATIQMKVISLQYEQQKLNKLLKLQEGTAAEHQAAILELTEAFHQLPKDGNRDNLDRLLETLKNGS